MQAKKVFITLSNNEILSGKLVEINSNFVAISDNKNIQIIPIKNVIYISFKGIKSDVQDIFNYNKNEKYIEIKIPGISETSKIKIPVNRDYFEENFSVLTDLKEKSLKRKMMYVNNLLYLSGEKAKKAILNSGFPVKVNGRKIESMEDLDEVECDFIGWKNEYR